MKPKILAFLTAATLLTSTINAQDSKITFGIRFGGALTNVTGKDSRGNSLQQDMKVGAHIGVNVEIPIAPSYYFQPGLLISNKGSKITEVITTRTVTSTTYLTYIEIPLNVLYKPQFRTGNLLFGIGPYVAYGIRGQFKQNPAGTNEKLTFKNTVTKTDPKDGNYIKPFDAGINILAGYQFKSRFSLQLNGQFGLVGIQPKFEADPNDQSSYKNIGFGISFGYRFNPKK